MTDKQDGIAPRDRVSLTVGGVDYGGWLDVSISAGIERQARDFRVSLTRRWPGMKVAPRAFREGELCEVRIGADLVLTGYVFAMPCRYDATTLSVGVSGRSLTADLVDCAAVNKPGQWKKQPVLRIVEALASPYGIHVVNEVGATLQVSDHQIQPGESAFESIDKLLRKSQLLSTDDAHGRLVLARPGSAGRAADALELGKNVLSGDAALDFSQVFSEYTCKGQRSGSTATHGKNANELSATSHDARVSRRRVLMVQESGQMTAELCRQRVEWERASRMGKALAASYTVAGWRQSNGALWRHNSIVRVIDPLCGFDRDMLIGEIEYRLDGNGTSVVMKVAPLDAFNPEPADPVKGRKRKGKTKKGDEFEYLIPADWEKK